MSIGLANGTYGPVMNKFDRAWVGGFALHLGHRQEAAYLQESVPPAAPSEKLKI